MFLFEMSIKKHSQFQNKGSWLPFISPYIPLAFKRKIPSNVSKFNTMQQHIYIYVCVWGCVYICVGVGVCGYYIDLVIKFISKFF